MLLGPMCQWPNGSQQYVSGTISDGASPPILGEKDGTPRSTGAYSSSSRASTPWLRPLSSSTNQEQDPGWQQIP
ncbi:hypothetical protein U9M48_030293 [Paspalum notatum var. saurae]|uniref:Uncharacterized protein n=1 Tax=Paspalum notatum var. saurae TaxID=547442 RepID=A0AAQ3U0H5_PASNO